MPKQKMTMRYDGGIDLAVIDDRNVAKHKKLSGEVLLVEEEKR